LRIIICQSEFLFDTPESFMQQFDCLNEVVTHQGFTFFSWGWDVFRHTATAFYKHSLGSLFLVSWFLVEETGVCGVVFSHED